MKAKYLVFFVFFLLLFLVFFLSPKEERLTLEKEKIIVIDGDTIKYEGKYYRIVGIDTPEKERQKEYILKKFGFKNESCLKLFGLEAKSLLEELIKNSSKIEIKIVGKDKYNRFLVILYADNKDIAEILVKKGYAFLYEKSIYHKKYFDEFIYAKNNKLGVWSCS